MEVEEAATAAPATDDVMQEVTAVAATSTTILTDNILETPQNSATTGTAMNLEQELVVVPGPANAAQQQELNEDSGDEEEEEVFGSMSPVASDVVPPPIIIEPNVDDMEVVVLERDPDMDEEQPELDEGEQQVSDNVVVIAEEDPLVLNNDTGENEVPNEDEETLRVLYRGILDGDLPRTINDRLAMPRNVSRVNYHYPSQGLLQMRRAMLSFSRGSRNRRYSEQAAPEDNAEEDESAAANAQQSPPAEPANTIDFDTSLPAEHSYMGANMNRVAGVEYLDVGEEYTTLLFLHQHVVFPGEVLPFMISGSIIDADIESNNGQLFGVCFPFMPTKRNDNAIYGVTCQIYEKGTDVRGHTLIKSRALQRFVTTSDTTIDQLEYINDNPRPKQGDIRILPEIFLREPLKCLDMGSMNRFRDIAAMQQQFQRLQAATTQWPAHVYNYYDISSIVEKARQSLAQHKIETMPTDPTQLSFWLARNLHLSEDLMSDIFMNDSVNVRMKLIASTFKEESIFVCRICGNRIANCRELFAMSKHGVQTHYCNSAGYIHETNTVYQLMRGAIVYNGEPSSEFSWFPGYQWHIIVCKICTRHIGWEFKALDASLVPKSFFGLSSSSVRISDVQNAPTSPTAEILSNFIRLTRGFQ